MERFSCTTEIVSGPGAISVLGTLGARRLFLVTDPFFMKNGAAQRVAAAAGAEETEFFDRVVPDPSVTLAAEGTARLRDFGPDLLVALGGGSAMDCAKAMRFFAGTGCRFAAIPTTSGSGSEVTDFAILTHDGVKHPLVDRQLRPDYAILDSDFLTDLPASLIADAGFDVLTHALEAYVAKNAGAFPDALARDAFSTVYSLLPASFSGCREVRLKIHQAATMAGLSFTMAGLGLCHALSHALGGAFHVPHGRLNAIVLPAVIGANAPAAMHRYAEIARAAGIEGTADTVAVRNLRSALVSLRRQLELPATLAQAGVPPRQVRERTQAITAAVLADPCCGTNPVVPDEKLVKSILGEVTGRG